MGWLLSYWISVRVGWRTVCLVLNAGWHESCYLQGHIEVDDISRAIGGLRLSCSHTIRFSDPNSRASDRSSLVLRISVL